MPEINKDKFNLWYLFKGEGKKDWFRAAGFGWRFAVIALVLALIGFTVWKAFFVKTTSVHVEKGGVANIYNQAKRFFIPFAEVSVGKEKNYPDLNYGVRIGLRFEF